MDLLELRGQGPPTARMYAQILERYPQQASLWLALGQMRAAEGDWQGAAAAGEEARRLSPGLRAVPVFLAGVYHHLGRLSEAVEACRQAIAQSPAEAGRYNNLTAALAAAGKTAEALEATRQALELDPANARAAQNLRQLTQVGGAPSGLTAGGGKAILYLIESPGRRKKLNGYFPHPQFFDYRPHRSRQIHPRRPSARSHPYPHCQTDAEPGAGQHGPGAGAGHHHQSPCGAYGLPIKGGRGLRVQSHRHAWSRGFHL
ncbi:MAG: tetratricopeptide repeat protein [Candidatus Latescibacteria bacterium]|nr:tetratricopeptide repeat protein [Candidatus Latescibacterota bacterium]